MADLKISQLNSLAGSSLANNDVVAVVDTSASETKKITSKDLVQYGYGLVDASTLDGDIIEPGTTSARGTVQLTDSTSSTSTTTAATPNAVKSAYDLANAAMPKAGGTFTGNISFEGSTDDAFETTFAITDPTADRTITFKDESGTVAYLSDISGISTFLPLTGGTMTGQILGDDSTSASTPGYAFDGDPDTGLLRTGTNEIALVTGGTARLTADASGNVNIPGNLSVQGTTTTIDSTTLVVKDKNIEMGAVTTPTDVTADGGGITLRGTTDKTINWIDSTDAWTFSEHISIASGKEFRINGTKVLDATSLGSAVVSSSLTSLGTIGTGTWQGTTIATGYGGTGQTSYTDGQLLIGKTDGTLAKSTLTAGSAITVTNGNGSITIASTAVTSVTASSPLASTGGTTPDISIQDGTTSQKGAVQLEDSTSSTSTTKAATPNSVKSAYDLANAALPAATAAATYAPLASPTFTGTVADGAGNLRRLIQNAKTAAYTLVASDTGKHISITTGGVTIPSGVFAAGDIITIFNNSASNQTITAGASTTVRQAGTALTGNRTLAQYGVATVLCIGSDTFVISGSGLS